MVEHGNVVQSAVGPTTLPENPPEPGDLVQVRSRRWLVGRVEQPSRSEDSPVVHLACADDDAQGQEQRVYWNYELDRRILKDEGWAELGRRSFDDPGHFAAFFHTQRWNCVTAADPRLIQVPFRAGIRLNAYQMEPLRKARRLPRVNLFIADDTGLGKTIEAGLIARELLLRKKVSRIVVAAAPSMLEQWKAELEERFGLIFEILDREYVTRIRRDRGFSVNPWCTHSRFLVSHRLLVSSAYADPMREWLGPLLPGSLLILDEGSPRRAGVGRSLRNREQVHAGRSGPVGALRASTVPVGDPAQRSLDQLHHVAGTAGPVPLHSGRQGAGKAGPGRRDGTPPQGGCAQSAGGIPKAGSDSQEIDRTAAERSGDCSVETVGRVPVRPPLHPSDIFETFPFPKNWETHPSLEVAGKEYYQFRADLMVRNNEGLTKTYNRFHDPNENDSEIARLRELHTAMDRVVLNAYPLPDIRAECKFLLDYEINEEEWGRMKKPYRYRWPDHVRNEVLARLLELNGKRAAEEAATRRAGRNRAAK